MLVPFDDRVEDGRQLATALQHYRRHKDVLVLAPPRGGVPVAYEFATSLGVDLDLMVVRKLGTPGNPELAMGAIASGGVRVLNPEVLAWLTIPQEAIERAAASEARELARREKTYRGQCPWTTDWRRVPQCALRSRRSSARAPTGSSLPFQWEHPTRSKRCVPRPTTSCVWRRKSRSGGMRRNNKVETGNVVCLGSF